MAPNFLSKFSKSSNSPNGRDRSLSTSRDPSPLRRSQTPSLSTSSFGTDSSINKASRNQSRTNTPDPDRLSVDTNPSVIIGVIPPSPRATIHSDISFPSDEESQAAAAPPPPPSPPPPPPPGKETLQERRNEGSQRRGTLSFSVNRPSTSVDFTEDALATPTPAVAGYGRSNTSQDERKFSLLHTATHSRTLTPSSSTGNLRQFVQQAEAHSPGSMLLGNNAKTSGPASAGLPSRSSDRSIHSDTQPIPMAPHNRAATIAAGWSSFDSVPSSTSSGVDETGLLNSMTPISESPTAIRGFSPPQSPTPDVISRTQTLNPNLLSAGGGKDSDSISIASSSGKKKRTWRRTSVGSPKKKPTGLASAIAASGLAMANPAMSSPQFSATQVQTPTSASSGSPKQNGTTNRKQTLTQPHSRHTAAASAASLDAPRRSRQPSISLSNRSETSDGVYDSGLDGSSNGDDSGSEDELDLHKDIPVTGFAVASYKRNADFHELFSSIPEGDYLIEDYGCALQREILIQGRLYISENHICFHANIFGWITDLSIPIYEIVSLEKKMTAYVIPNAIQITTRQAKYSFASFLSRDTTFDVIHNIWRLARPDDGIASPQGSGRGSLDNARPAMDELREDVSLDGVNSAAINAAVVAAAAKAAGKPAFMKNKVTRCACGKKGEHYSETALETIVPGTPDKIYNLMFASGFIKEFMKGEQKLMDIQISDWAPTSPDSKLLARNMSYIKPLNASLGPKQTKCEIRDETIYCDFEDYVVTITTTRTPDVPSGGVFSVKTRTCFMWASAVSTKVIVTSQVEWTGRSFIKGIIERSAIDGQKTYHADLDRAMRLYIQEHQSEFVPEGVEAIAVAPIEPQTPAVDLGASAAAGGVLDDKAREHERNQRGLQWAYDTFEGAYGVAKRSTSGALELIRDAWDQSTSTTILIFVIVILVMSNLYTLTMVGRREDSTRRKQIRKTEEREQWVQGIVTALWEELAAGNKPGAALPPTTSAGGNWQQEVANINKTLDAVEERIRLIRESLNALD